jgi:apolipoprotein N-acyltransferase
MKSHFRKVTGNSDRFSYLWLVLAFVLSLFAMNGSWDFPLAAWLYPLFLLRFTRTHRPFRGFLAASLINAAAACVLAFQIGFGMQILILAAVVVVAIFMSLPYLVDRLISPRFSGIVGTLIFPLSFVAADYLKTLFYPFSSIGSLAYTQYGNLPLLQLLSITGLSGIVFLITWFASVVNWAWQQHFVWPRIRLGVLLYSGLLGLVLMGGGLRLALFPPQGHTVRVAGISVSQTVETLAMKHIATAFPAFLAGRATQSDLETIRQGAAMLNSDLLTQSQREASSGARIVVWPECGAAVLQADESALLGQAAVLARQTHMYLDMGLCILTNQSPHEKDQAVLIDPQGQVVWSYDKARPVPGLDLSTPGNGKVPTVNTPYGRISNVICFDGDFPYLSRQAGQAQASLMLVLSNDWRQIDPWHTQDITFRAIENGFSLVRQTSNGLAMAVDYEGRVLASSDYFATGDQVLIASVPIQGIQTIYTIVGDLFAQICVAGLIILMTVSLIRSRKQRLIRKPVDENVSSTPEPDLVG